MKAFLTIFTLFLTLTPLYTSAAPFDTWSIGSKVDLYLKAVEFMQNHEQTTDVSMMDINIFNLAYAAPETKACFLSGFQGQWIASRCKPASDSEYNACKQECARSSAGSIPCNPKVFGNGACIRPSNSLWTQTCLRSLIESAGVTWTADLKYNISDKVKIYNELTKRNVNIADVYSEISKLCDLAGQNHIAQDMKDCEKLSAFAENLQSYESIKLASKDPVCPVKIVTKNEPEPILQALVSTADKIEQVSEHSIEEDVKNLTPPTSKWNMKHGWRPLFEMPKIHLKKNKPAEPKTDKSKELSVDKNNTINFDEDTMKPCDYVASAKERKLLDDNCYEKIYGDKISSVSEDWVSKTLNTEKSGNIRWEQSLPYTWNGCTVKIKYDPINEYCKAPTVCSHLIVIEKADGTSTQQSVITKYASGKNLHLRRDLNDLLVQQVLTHCSDSKGYTSN